MKEGGRGVSRLNGWQVHGAVGDGDKEREQIASRVVHGEVALVFPHHHHQDLPAAGLQGLRCQAICLLAPKQHRGVHCEGS